eukprot:4993592-Prymnesium_polylepis.1
MVWLACSERLGRRTIPVIMPALRIVAFSVAHAVTELSLETPRGRPVAQAPQSACIRARCAQQPLSTICTISASSAARSSRG